MRSPHDKAAPFPLPKPNILGEFLSILVRVVVKDRAGV